MRRSVLSLVISLAALATRGQVKGIVIDSVAKKPVDKVVVGMVIKSNPTDTIYTFTDEKGQFRFDLVPSSNFSVTIRNMGYQPSAKFIPVTKSEKTIDIGIVILSPREKTLDEVTVEAPAITIKEDTIEYNAASFKVKENAVVEDLLKKMPGITVDKDGNVTAQGKTVTRVKVNGKDFFGGDVKTATRELPANIVDKIQVVDDYGDQATVSGIKDGDPDKIINITIRKDKNKGFFGRATAGAGTDDRYQASFNGNYFNNNRQISLVANSNNTNSSLFDFGAGGNRGAISMIRTGLNAISNMGGLSGAKGLLETGLGQIGTGSNSGVTATNSFGVNYRDQWGKRVSVYGSYSYSHKNNAALSTSSTESFYTNPTQEILRNSDDGSFSNGDNHRFTFNLEWQVDSFNYLKISPAISYGNNNGNANTPLFEYYINDTLAQNGSNSNLSNTKTPNISATVLYNHKFRKRGRNFSASITYGNSESNSTQDIADLSYQYTSPGAGPRNLYQFIDQENNNYNYGVRFTYSEPINKHRSVDLSYSHNLNYAKNDKQTFNVDSLTKIRTLNNFLSNDYDNNFYNNRMGISLRTTMKKYNYTLGISLQPVDLQGKSITKDSSYNTISRVNIFPIARMSYNFTKTKAINGNYSGNATQPTFSQLQPVTDFSNPQSVTAGNPDLKPAINHNINLTYNNFNFISGKVLFTNFTFSTIMNQIVNKTARLGNGGGSISIPENVNGYYDALGFYTYSRPYKNRKYVITFNGNLNYNHNISLTDSVRLIGNNLTQNLDLRKIIGNNWIVSQGANFEFNYKDWLEFGSGVSYSLNENKYKGANGQDLSAFQNTSSNAWTFSSNINVDLTSTLVLKYDFDYTINSGLASSVTKNPAIMNASLEEQLFKKKNGIIKFAAYDLFKQNSNISRSVNANSIIDTRTNRLTRYFMLTFTYRLQKFKGQQSQGASMRSIKEGRDNMRF